MLLLLLLGACEHDGSTTSPSIRPARFDAAQELQVEICPWAGGKLAALTFTFDDTRATSHAYAAPLLEDYGFRGTFNLNTRAAAGNWDPWIDLWKRGHELGNHTWGHQRLTDIPLEQARFEIERGRTDLIAHIPGMHDVVSFTYPEGQSNPAVREIVLEQHLGARGYWGWNSPQPADYALLRCRAWAGVDQFAADLAHCFSRGGWMMQNFHAVVAGGPTEREFLAMLEIAQAHRDSLWVGTQGEVTKYTLARAQAKIEIVGDNPAHIFAGGIRDPRLSDVTLTLRISTTSPTIKFLDVNDVRYSLSIEGSTLIDIPVGIAVKVTARDQE